VPIYFKRGQSLLDEGRDAAATAQFELARKNSSAMAERIDAAWAKSFGHKAWEQLAAGKPEHGLADVEEPLPSLRATVTWSPGAA
jgi:hypothetical protein